jgi:hypothetical protein
MESMSRSSTKSSKREPMAMGSAVLRVMVWRNRSAARSRMGVAGGWGMGSEE